MTSLHETTAEWHPDPLPWPGKYLEEQCPRDDCHGGHEWWFSKKANYWCGGHR